MRRFKVAMLSLLMFASLTGCSLLDMESRSENEAEIVLFFDDTESKKEQKMVTDYSQADLFAMFEEMNNETIIDFYYDDYNKDGVHEAFVVTKADCYRLWYMTADNCEIIKDEIETVNEIETNIEGMQTKDYLFLQLTENDKKVTYVYSVDNNNKAFQPNISARGHIVRQPDGEICLNVINDIASTNSMNKSVTTTYYLYYSLDDGFKEYGAIPINKEQFLEFAGATEILEAIETKYTDYHLDYSFLYRSNHYIHINVMLLKDGSVEYKNMTLYYDNSKVSVISEDTMSDGRIETAYMLEIATFPISFKHPTQEITE